MKNFSPLFENIILNCSLTSDIHIDSKNPIPWFPKMILKKSLKDCEESLSPVDYYISVGDTTSRASDINWKMTKECFAKYNPSKRIFLALGNHDTWSDDGFEKAIERYLSSVYEICGREQLDTYFCDTIKGYYFIFLGSDNPSGCEASFSDEEINWFNNIMSEAGKSEKPIFVFCHQSINQKHGLPKTWDFKERPDRDIKEGGIGIQSDVIYDILKKHKNVFYFSGHSHMGLCGEKSLIDNGYSSIEEHDGITFINLPCLTGLNHHGEINSPGIGFQLEVYQDRVIIRPRNIVKRKWIDKISIQNKNHYYEKLI